MSDNQQDSGNHDETAQKSVALELVFISFVGLVVVGAFIAALNYDFVSARAPLVIIVPLLILVSGPWRYQSNCSVESTTSA